MTVVTSACVDCATPIIGDRLRCPACHDQHAKSVIAAVDAADDVNATTPRPRQASVGFAPSFLASWTVIVEMIAIVALLSVLAFKGCS